MSSVVVFFKTGETTVPVEFEAGDVVELSSLNDKMMVDFDKEKFKKLTKEQLKNLLHNLGFSITHFQKAKKDDIIDILGSKWNRIVSKASQIASASTGSLSDVASTPVVVDKPVETTSDDAKHDVKQKVQFPEITVRTFDRSGQLIDAGIGFGSETTSGDETKHLEQPEPSVVEEMPHDDSKDAKEDNTKDAKRESKKSHMTILIPMGGMTIHTGYSYSVGETFDEIAQKLPSGIGEKMGGELKFRIGKSFIEGWETASSILTPDMNTVEIVPSFNGGGYNKKTVKHTLKKGVAKLVQSDEKAIMDTLKTALEISQNSTYNVQMGISELPVDSLEKLKEALSRSNKATNSAKVERLVEHLLPHSRLEVLTQKFILALESFKEMALNDLDVNFTGDDGSVDMEKIREAVSNTLAVKKASTAMSWEPKWHHFSADICLRLCA